MNLLYDFLKKLSFQYKLILLVFINFLLFFCFYMLLLVPQQEQLAQAQARNAAERQKIKAVESFVASKPNLDNYLTELDGNLVQINNLLPDQPEMSLFLQQAEGYARETGLLLTQVHTGQIVNKTGYREIPVEIGVSGSYVQTMQFVKKLEDGARFAAVRSLQMNSQGKETQSLPTAANSAQPVSRLASQPMLSSKLAVVIFAYGVPQQPTNPQGQAGQQNPSK